MDSTFNILKLLSDGILDDTMWFIVPSLQYKDKIQYEIQYIRKEKKPWAFRPKGDKLWERCSTLDILDAMNEQLLDLGNFHQQLCNNLLMQVAYMDMRIKKIRSLLGDDIVDCSLKAYADFGKTLVDVIDKIINKKPTLTVVE